MKTDESASPRSSSPGFFRRAVNLYVDGFRTMGPVGRNLWLLILIKLFVMFCILKAFFFPDLLERDYDNDADRAEAVRSALLDRER